MEQNKKTGTKRVPKDVWPEAQPRQNPEKFSVPYGMPDDVVRLCRLYFQQNERALAIVIYFYCGDSECSTLKMFPQEDDLEAQNLLRTALSSLSAHYAITSPVQISCANLNILAESNLRTQINCPSSSGCVGPMRFRPKRHTSVYRGAMAWLRLDGKLAAHQL